MFQRIEKKLKGKSKGVVQLTDTVIGLVLVAASLGIGAIVLAGLNDNTSDANASQVLNKGSEGLTTLGDFLPTIATVVVGIFLLGLLFILRGTRGGASV